MTTKHLPDTIHFEYTIKSRNDELPDTFKLNYWKGDYRSINQDLASVDGRICYLEKVLRKCGSVLKTEYWQHVRPTYPADVQTSGKTRRETG